jgi:CRISPR-associated endoribonuclease Cas6
MRIHLIISASEQIVPFDHQHLLTRCIYSWLGESEEHDSISLYSFSRLANATYKNEGLSFNHGTSFFFSAFSSGLIKRLLQGVQKTPDMFYGLKVREIIIQEEPDLEHKEKFLVASPIFIKRRNKDNIDHVVFDDMQAGEYLKETLLTKMALANINDGTLEVSFDTSYRNAKTCLINYKGIDNRANICPVIIKGRNETKLFAWNVGLGNSTGIGFGAIK